MNTARFQSDPRARWHAGAAVTVALLCLPATSHASLLSGEALDTAANVIAWIALLIVPVVLIAVFWIVHILPEKIAEKRKHPQLDAIKTLCLLSLFFGGLLWPLAWLWAYTKPVLHRMAYGTDIDDRHGHGGDAFTPLHDATQGPTEETSPAPADDAQDEVETLRSRVRSLEMALAMSRGPTRNAAPPPPGRTPDNDEE